MLSAKEIIPVLPCFNPQQINPDHHVIPVLRNKEAFLQSITLCSAQFLWEAPRQGWLSPSTSKTPSPIVSGGFLQAFGTRGLATVIDSR